MLAQVKERDELHVVRASSGAPEGIMGGVQHQEGFQGAGMRADGHNESLTTHLPTSTIVSCRRVSHSCRR